MPRTPGRHFLQLPGPSNVPDRVLHAMAQPTIDHRGPAFARMTRRILDRLKEVFGPNYVVSPSHECLLPNVPPQNVCAMAEAAVE